MLARTLYHAVCMYVYIQMHTTPYHLLLPHTRHYVSPDTPRPAALGTVTGALPTHCSNPITIPDILNIVHITTQQT